MYEIRKYLKKNKKKLINHIYHNMEPNELKDLLDGWMILNHLKIEALYTAMQKYQFYPEHRTSIVKERIIDIYYTIYLNIEDDFEGFYANTEAEEERYTGMKNEKMLYSIAREFTIAEEKDPSAVPVNMPKEYEIDYLFTPGNCAVIFDFLERIDKE